MFKCFLQHIEFTGFGKCDTSEISSDLNCLYLLVKKTTLYDAYLFNKHFVN